MPAASSTLPKISNVPLTPVVGGGPALKADGGGEDVSQKPWLWLLFALVALVIGALVFSQCSGSEGPPPTSVVGSQDTSGDSATANTGVTTTPGSSTTTVSSIPSSVPSSVPNPSTVPITQPTTPGGTGPSSIAPEQLIGLQAQCIYGNDADACATLVSGGYTAESNYGLGDTLSSRTDADLSADCSANIDQLACLELASRYPGTAADETTATEFADAVIAGDVSTVESLSAVYVTEQNPELVSGPYTATEAIPGTQYSDGKFAFTLDESNKAVCWISDGVVVFCLINPA